jgi:hypothetical protein
MSNNNLCITFISKWVWDNYDFFVSFSFLIFLVPIKIKDIRKVRKREHEYPEFGHAQGEIKKRPAKKYISIK